MLISLILEFLFCYSFFHWNNIFPQFVCLAVQWSLICLVAAWLPLICFLQHHGGHIDIASCNLVVARLSSSSAASRSAPARPWSLLHCDYFVLRRFALSFSRWIAFLSHSFSFLLLFIQCQLLLLEHVQTRQTTLTPLWVESSVACDELDHESSLPPSQHAVQLSWVPCLWWQYRRWWTGFYQI